MDVEKPQIFINKEEMINFVLALTPKEARIIGVSKNGPSYLKKKFEGGIVKF